MSKREFHQDAHSGVDLDPIFSSLKSLSGRDQQVLISLMSLWLGLKARKRALFVKLVVPGLTDDEVARRAGVSRTSLFRWPEYLRLKGHVDPRRRDRRGFKTKDRSIEGFDEDGEDGEDGEDDG